MSRPTSPQWPEQPARRPARESCWLSLAYVLGTVLAFFGLAAVGLLIIAASHFNTVGGNK